MANDRNNSFIAAARAMRAPADSAIEHTVFSGGGVRLKGFKSIKGRWLKHVLHAYGKRAVVRVNTVSDDCIFIDCYDDIDPTQLTACTPENMQPQPTADGPSYQYGAVVYQQYTCDTLSSENLKRLFMEPSVLDIKIQSNGFTLMTVAATSTKIVGGLDSQTLTNSVIRMQPDNFKKKIFFKKGACRGQTKKHATRYNRLKTWALNQ